MRLPYFFPVYHFEPPYADDCCFNRSKLQVWNACKPNKDESDQPNYEMDVLSGHENDVNYVQFRLYGLCFVFIFNQFIIGKNVVSDARCCLIFQWLCCSIEIFRG